MNIFNLVADASASNAGGSGNMMIVTVIYLVFIVGFMYFVMIRPQSKKEKERQEVVNSVEVGDSILTTSGFYGVVIDVTDDTVIVEFGSNKNCRIPMQKSAIVEVEKVGN